MKKSFAVILLTFIWNKSDIPVGALLLQLYEGVDEPLELELLLVTEVIRGVVVSIVTPFEVTSVVLQFPKASQTLGVTEQV